MEEQIIGINKYNPQKWGTYKIINKIKEMDIMNNIKTDTTMNKGGDGNKGFDTLRVFEAFA